ncbi:hypothetical protein VTK73DRAFT_6967 [Phialemonium thermophilum]|uniref:Sensitive to high expression protein 9, mitochondrial n=1 Tax=Phialemonium thermophilum TaxID=223376 RepID=A0ABR3WHU6_9PEZI
MGSPARLAWKVLAQRTPPALGLTCSVVAVPARDPAPLGPLWPSKSGIQVPLRHDFKPWSFWAMHFSTNPPSRTKSADYPSPNSEPKSEKIHASAPSETDSTSIPCSTGDTASASSTTSDESTPSASDPATPRHEPTLPSTSESRRGPAAARFSTFMDNLQSRVLIASQALNDLTGYSAIEAIKAQNADLERRHAASQTRLHDARQSYKSLTARRAATQREVTALLARKDAWTPADLERFTALYRLDHELEGRVAAAADELTEAETEEDRLAAALNAGILRRYHEEQIWSDRIRRQSTWGTWGLMGVNVLLFLALQFVAEPWRRQRLIRGIAESEKSALEEVRRELGEVKAALEAARSDTSAATDNGYTQATVVAGGEDTRSLDVAAPFSTAGLFSGAVVGISWTEALLDPTRWRNLLSDLGSDRRIDLRMRDVTSLALQGAATGAAVAAALAFAFLRRT